MQATLVSAADVDARLRAASSLCEVFQATAAERAEEVALRTPGGAQELTWREYAARVGRIAAGLEALGVGRGDAVALMMLNRPEFALADCAAMHLGAAPFSIYNTLPAETIEYVLGNAGARVVVCEQQFAPALLAARAGTDLEHVVCLRADVPETLSLAQLEASPAAGFDLHERWRALDGDDLLTLIYTSGTTGPPKGVEITHANMLAQLRATASALPTEPGGRTISYLPSAHIADRWSTHYTALAHGRTVTYLADPTQLMAALLEVRPTVWGGVPRVWEKLQAGLDAAIAADPDAARRAKVLSAIEVGREVVRREQAGEPLDGELRAAHAQAEEQVLRPLRERLGLEQAESIVVGAAPPTRELLEFFRALGLELLELWGMSELSCVCTTNRPHANRIGTVGQAIPDVELALAEDGELLVRGPMVMRGYRGEPAKTAAAIDAQGWLHTGDIGQIDEQGFVSIVDRKKELIINAAGKNMSPANIEAQLKSAHPLIGQAVCVGDRRPYNVALLVLEPEAAATWARAHEIEDPSPAQLAVRKDLRAELDAAVARANEHLARVEQIKRFSLLGAEWLPGGDELTPTMKLRRKPIAEKYAAEIESLYS
ncbi:MAG TPA: AMP-dependent synthetase/ligase [Solirubrobacteraceae bacterium]|nr:AMP-dependent synthetase/ligase [Solirubrobacteraceae bacterium]